MAFAVDDLDAYERRMRRGARWSAVVGIGFWTAIFAQDVPGEVSVAAAAVAAALGAAFGVGLSLARRGDNPLTTKVDAIVERFARDRRMLRNWLPIAVTVIPTFAAVFATRFVISLFTTAPPVSVFGYAGWTSVTVQQWFDAERYGRMRRERYENDLKALQGFPG